MRRQPWSDRISAAAIAACFHVLAILFLGLVSPTLHTPPRSPDLDTPEPVIEVELTRMPAPTPKPAPRERIAAADATPPEPPQVLARPPSPSMLPDSAPILQPTPQPQAPPQRLPAPPAPDLEAKAQAQEAPKPVEPTKVREKEKDKDKDKPQTQLAAAPASAPLPPVKPTSAPPSALTPGFRLPPGYGRPVEAEGVGGLRGVLRATVGCAHENYIGLTQAERERCATAYVRDASRGARVDPVPSDKRNAYDVEAAANVRRRAAKEGGTASPVVACDGPGANLGGGCLPAEAHTGARRDAPPPQ